MVHFCLIIVVDGNRRIVQRCKHICLDVPDVRRVVMDAVQNILDMSIVQFHEPALHNFRRPVLSGAANSLCCAAYGIDQQFKDFINASLIIGLALLQVIDIQMFSEISLIRPALIHLIPSHPINGYGDLCGSRSRIDRIGLVIFRFIKISIISV